MNSKDRRVSRTEKLEFPTVKIQEGSTTVVIPLLHHSEGSDIQRLRSQAPVFYNPQMSLNRDTAVLALSAHQRRLSRPVSACEPMCGSGVRGVRLALEVEGLEHVTMGDLSPSATRLASINAAANGVSDRVTVRTMGAHQLLSLHARPLQRFDYVDVDPYGSPSPFLDTAMRSCKKGGLLALTATDMAPLCGVYRRACLRKYGGVPLRTEYCHGLALRLLVGSLVTTAARHEVAVKPVFSYAADHYVRVYVTLDRGSRKADACLGEMGYMRHCFTCLHREAVKRESILDSRDCNHCGSRMEMAGPLWLGELAETSFCDDMLECSERSILSSNVRLVEMIRLVRGEVGLPPGYYNIDLVCSKLRVASTPVNGVLDALRREGYVATMSHIDNRGIKTDADASTLLKIVSDHVKGGTG
ncbi:MAG TPA: tRNA (guanine(10)-N(2))-dimethyltransferase [Patescibacteria group bacterium]|nr:tRNA (guanine(10)-N(2))-dimethyltransferase [Patescibacteria group bacterium]